MTPLLPCLLACILITPEEREARLATIDHDGDGASATEDCDDNDPEIGPYQSELCDGIDNDCDGEVDEGSAADATAWHVDADGDGYGDPASAELSCTQIEGRLTDDRDCDDSNATIHPGQLEDCDGVDQNCTEGDEIYLEGGEDLGDLTEEGGLEGIFCLDPGTYSFPSARIGWDGIARIVGTGGSGQTFFEDDDDGDQLDVSGRDTEILVQGITFRGAYEDGFEISHATGTMRDVVVKSTDIDASTTAAVTIEDSTLLMEDVAIYGNDAWHCDYAHGVGLRVEDSALTMRRVLIAGNDADELDCDRYSEHHGLGMYVDNSTVDAENVIFAGNDSSGDPVDECRGFGLAAFYSELTLTNTTFAGNIGTATCETGGGSGVHLYMSDANMVNTVLAGNIMSAEDGAHAAVFVQDGSLECSYCARWENQQDDSYEATDGDVDWDWSFDADPDFQDQSGEPWEWDLRLDGGSSLIDAGDPAIQDADGSRSDIGAYGGPESW